MTPNFTIPPQKMLQNNSHAPITHFQSQITKIESERQFAANNSAIQPIKNDLEGLKSQLNETLNSVLHLSSHLSSLRNHVDQQGKHINNARIFSQINKKLQRLHEPSREIQPKNQPLSKTIPNRLIDLLGNLVKMCENICTEIAHKQVYNRTNGPRTIPNRHIDNLLGDLRLICENTSKAIDHKQSQRAIFAQPNYDTLKRLQVSPKIKYIPDSLKTALNLCDGNICREHKTPARVSHPVTDHKVQIDLDKCLELYQDKKTRTLARNLISQIIQTAKLITRKH